MTYQEPSTHPADPILSMTNAQATAELEKRTIEYREANRPVITGTTPPAVAAHIKLGEMQGDPATRAKLLSGDADTVAAFRKLNATLSDPASQADLALHGVRPADHVNGTPGAVPLESQIHAVNAWRANGWDEGTIREALTGLGTKTGQPPSAAVIAEAKALRARLHGDPVWKKAYLAGSRAEVLQSQYLSVIIGSEAVREL